MMVNFRSAAQHQHPAPAPAKQSSSIGSGRDVQLEHSIRCSLTACYNLEKIDDGLEAWHEKQT